MVDDGQWWLMINDVCYLLGDSYDYPWLIVNDLDCWIILLAPSELVVDRINYGGLYLHDQPTRQPNKQPSNQPLGPVHKLSSVPGQEPIALIHGQLVFLDIWSYGYGGFKRAIIRINLAQ